MNYIVFGAGKTAYTIKRYIENCNLGDSIVGFFDFYDNNPFNPNYRIGFDHYSEYFDGSVLYFY